MASTNEPGRTSRVKVAVGLLALSLLPSRWAAAEPAADPKQQVAEAERECLLGEYARGVEILVSLFLSSRHPIYLYNQARCFEQNGQFVQAAGRYREFLRKVANLEPNAPERDDLKPIDLKKVEALVSNFQRDKGDPEPVRPAASANAGSSKPVDVHSVVKGPAESGHGWRVAGVSAMVLGGVAAATGITFGLLKNRTEQQVAQKYDPEQERFGQRSAQIATGALIAAPVLVGLGILSYRLGGTAPTGSAQVSIHAAPELFAAGFGAGLALRY